MKRLTALTTLAVITVAWLGLTLWMKDEPDEPDDPTAPHAGVDLPPAEPVPAPPEPNNDDDDEPESYEPASPAKIDADALTARGAISHPALAQYYHGEVYAELEFEAVDERPEERAPLNVALVVDRSGSMNGRPLDQAKRAAHTFVDGLEAKDRVSLIAFDGQVRTEVSSTVVDGEGRELLHGAIDRLHTRGSTNLSGGLEVGSREVARHSSPEMVQRVVLLTDGQPNNGITHTEGLTNKAASIRKNGVSVSTLGFGTNYDAELLGAIATEGAGNFEHISDSADLERAFADELDDMASTVASGLKVDLEPSDGVRIEQVYGFSRDQVDGAERITLGDLEADARRSAVVKLSLSGSNLEPGSLRDLVDVRVDFRDRLADRAVGKSMALDTRITSNEDDVEEARDSEVMARVEEQRSLANLAEVEERYESGDREGAQRRIEQERKRLERARKSHDIADDSGAFDGVKKLLNKKEKDVKSFEPSSEGARNSAAESQDSKMDMMQGR